VQGASAAIPNGDEALATALLATVEWWACQSSSPASGVMRRLLFHVLSLAVGSAALYATVRFNRIARAKPQA
jgi:hypothetical protein